MFHFYIKNYAIPFIIIIAILRAWREHFYKAISTEST